MADTKISALTSLAGSAVEQTADVLPIVDTSTTTTKKILVSELSLAMHKLGTAVATTSGTSHDWTIPAWATEIKINLVGVSLDAMTNLLIQLGDSGGIENTGYNAAFFDSTSTGFSTAGFPIRTTSAADSTHGCLIFSLVDASTFTWAATGGFYNSTVGLSTSGSKSLSAALTTLRLTSVSGTANFDAGVANISYR